MVLNSALKFRCLDSNTLDTFKHLTYIVKESSRAKHVRLKISVQEGLVIVIPKNFDQRHLLSILKQKEAWITKHLPLHVSPLKAVSSPNTLKFRSLAQEWKIKYSDTHFDIGRLSWTEDSLQHILYLNGDISDIELVRKTIHQWLRHQGHQHLVPWLKRLSQQTGLDYNTVQIRKQKTRWGSCSNHLTISLNCTLLFLPSELARYVLLHELAHTQHLNHSKQFWRLLNKLEKNSFILDKDLSENGQKYVPEWL